MIGTLVCHIDRAKLTDSAMVDLPTDIFDCDNCHHSKLRSDSFYVSSVLFLHGMTDVKDSGSTISNVSVQVAASGSCESNSTPGEYLVHNSDMASAS